MVEPYVIARWVKVRLFLAAGSMAALFGVIGYRAYVLQVRESDHLRSMAEDQYLKDVELPSKRGRILDRNGAELAASAEVDSVHANQRLVGERAPQVAAALAEPLHVDRRELEKRLRGKRYFAWLKRRLTAEEARSVRELGLPGIYLDKEPRRYYPNRALAGPLLGWAGLDAVGQEGIELEYDRWLRGAASAVPGLRDALGRSVLVGGVADVPAQAGHDLYTTIDRYIQFRLEQALERGVTTHHARAGVALALDPRNGEILAMASVPSLNPNDPDTGSSSCADRHCPDRGVRNRAVTDVFEPGSTIKTFSLAGALESGAVQVDEHWYCENGKFNVGPATIHDAEKIGSATTTEVLAKSSNICTAKIAAREGRERLHDILARFGFGRRTGIDLPGERAGQLISAARMGPVEAATTSFGQGGISATPLQIAAGYASIANGGIWRRPHVLRQILDASGQKVLEARDEARRVIDPELAQTLREMLFAVTQPGGTAEKLSIPGYTFAGKTGTAQKVDPVTRQYSREKWASSFVGFAPAEDPQLVIFVMIDEPQGTHYGSMVAGPVFQETMIDALRWLGVPPNAAMVAANDAEARPTGAAPRKPSEARPAETIEANEDDGEDDGFLASADDPRSHGVGLAEVPDFSGMSIAEVLEVARRSGLRVEVLGSGQASSQSPGPGSARRGAACRVLFTPPG